MDERQLAEVVAKAVAAVMADSGRGVPADGQALELDSLMVVALVDALETQLPLRLRPQDVTAAHFATLQALTRLCRDLVARG